MFKSIFERLFWTNILMIVIVFLSVSATFAFFVNDFVTERQFELAKKSAQTIEYLTGYLQVENNNVRTRNSYKQNLSSWADFLGAEIIVTNLNGDVIEDTSNMIKTAPEEYMNSIKNDEIIRKMGNFGGAISHKVFTVGFPLDYNGNKIGAIFINTEALEMSKTVMHLLFMFLLASTMCIILAFAIVYRQSIRITKPINEINSAALDIAAGNFNERIRVTSEDEIGQLASSFNFMADSLEKLEDMRSQFVSDISHELRTPMTSISGFVQGILDDTIPKEKQDEYLKIVLMETNRLKKLVTDMLEMSKMSSSEYKLRVSEFDFVELVRLCIIGLEQKISEKELDLEVDFAKESLMVCADRDAIQRVIINLMDNAIKFGLSKTNIAIKIWVDNKKAYFSVGNFGEGIENSELPHIFDRFYKTDTSRTNKSSGAGLGLSFVKNIMLLHKQSVWVDSHIAKEGSDVKYTTFTFTLELA